MLEREEHPSREDWLEHRGAGLGASEAAAACGLSSWMTTTELWELKTGKRTAHDLSDNAAVAFGTHAEEHLRALFMLQHPELELEYHAFDFLYQTERPWLRCTLDGELIDRANNERGILEIKTAQCGSRTDWAKWRDHIPDHYYTQICHQFLATRYDFAYLFAMLIGLDGDAALRSYYFTRNGCSTDMEWLLQKEEKFWRCVEQDRVPPTTLRL